MIIAIVYHTSLYGLDGFLFSIEGIGLGMAVFILFYITGGMGAGDVKLMGAIGGLLGPNGVFAAFLFSAIIGGLYSLGALALNGHLIDSLRRYGITIKTFILTRRLVLIPSSEEVKKLRICYGVAIAIGTIFSVFWKNFI
jgi:prepilin peptidase CpaA